jgi:hypothetical protein
LPENTYNPPNTAAVVTSWTDQQDRRTIGLIAVAVTAVVWSWPTIFVKILSEDFGIFTQSFYRYLSSSAFFFAVSFLFMRDGLKKAAANIRVLIIPALLVSLFQTQSPLHDGAVIISRDGKIAYAGCILPLSNNFEVSKDFGTRHRAALGLSEESDALILVVSEENRKISLAYNGELIEETSHSTLKQKLKDILTGSK